MAVPETMQGAMSEQMAADSEVGVSDDMPCCPGKPSLPDCGKDRSWRFAAQSCCTGCRTAV
jgi:hypothetical protein